MDQKEEKEEKDKDEQLVINEIVKLLKKYYVNYQEGKYANIKTIKEFQELWGQEHGGYLTPEEIYKWKQIIQGTTTEKIEEGPIKYPEIKYVVLHNTKVKAIWIPSCPYNDKIIQKQYINIDNDLIMKHFSNTDTITIDLNHNYGGKDTVMMAALSPIFNMTKRRRYLYFKTKDKMVPGLFRVSDGCYSSTSNPTICGTKDTLPNIKNINVLIGETASAGEVIAISFKSISDQFNVSFYGYKTAGLTTYIKYFDLESNKGGIEIPIGYMADAFGNLYKDGVYN
ncbi:MAG: hypothetical protein Barrevirus14_14 [Barrevirus sp.]|uniref:Uncharacterized protein n=1 Tax=Barrevirus sp. TaxID=2487763 RepID=A0A3G4ZQJ3_9VIRU|nr:MAG: hypothetical protein Barrevirus14_14 [Barrevirus sp.]